MKKQNFTAIGENKSTLLSSFIIAILLGLTIWVIYPQTLDALSKWHDIEKDQSELKQLKEKAQVLASLNKTSLQSDLTVAQRILPAEKDVSAIIIAIEGLSNVSGTHTDTIGFSPGAIFTEGGASESAKTQEVPKNALPFSLSFDGTKTQVESVLDYYENVWPLLTISSVKIAYTTSGLAKGDFSAETHTLTLPTTLGKVSAPLPTLAPSMNDLIAKLRTFTNYESTNFASNQDATPSNRKNLFVR